VIIFNEKHIQMYTLDVIRVQMFQFPQKTCNLISKWMKCEFTGKSLKKILNSNLESVGSCVNIYSIEFIRKTTAKIPTLGRPRNIWHSKLKLLTIFCKKNSMELSDFDCTRNESVVTLDCFPR
jgi:hypothetical protein